jgi:hypothetical protein
MTDTVTANKPAAAMDVRAIIVHYHLFKTAGTSFERTLRTNLGPAWTAFEAGRGKSRPGGRLTSEELRDFLIEHPEIRAVSSHTLLMPPPQVPRSVVLPVLFVRHPIDRIRSIYEYERQQEQLTGAALKARSTSIAEFISWRLELAAQGMDRSFASFQTFRLAGSPKTGPELEPALDAIEGRVLIGTVEAYERSLERIGTALRPWYPELDLQAFHSNRTAAPVPMTERIAALRDELGGALYAELEAANQDDVRVWRRAMELVGADPTI